MILKRTKSTQQITLQVGLGKMSIVRILFLLLLLALPLYTFGYESGDVKKATACFIAMEEGKIIKEVGDCKTRHSPFSTFKIAIALMGFEADILHSSNAPRVEFDEDIEQKYFTHHRHPKRQYWMRSQNPQTWMQYSVVWYSRYITHKLGIEKFHAYVKKMRYGNRDIRGTLGKNDELMNSWIGSSLKISPREQINFLNNLVSFKLPFTKASQLKTIKLLQAEQGFYNWKIFAKTGGNKKLGWYIGWLEKADRKVLFVQLIKDNTIATVGAVEQAKKMAFVNLETILANSFSKK